MSTRDGTTPPSEVEERGSITLVPTPPESEYPGAAGQRRFPVAPFFPGGWEAAPVHAIAPGERLRSPDSCYHVGLPAPHLAGVLP